MLSIDTNILLPAVETRNAAHGKAEEFLTSLQDRKDVVISELVKEFGFKRVWNPLNG